MHGNGIDLSGKRFGMLTVLKEFTDEHPWPCVAWLCRCDCGKDKVVASKYLRNGRTNSCGCLRDTTQVNDIIGQVFGLLTVIERCGTTRDRQRRATWLCRCECGETKVCEGTKLRRGRYYSCGCKRRRRDTGQLGARGIEYKDESHFARVAKEFYGDHCELCGWCECTCDVHHRKPLARGGRNTIENAIVLCPNCHRIAHKHPDRLKSRMSQNGTGPSSGSRS